jgi:hypothetical protein
MEFRVILIYSESTVQIAYFSISFLFIITSTALGYIPPPDHTFLPIGEDDQFDLFESISTLFNFQIRDENFIYIISPIHGNYISALKINLRVKRRVYRENLYTLNYAFIFFTTTSLLN